MIRKSKVYKRSNPTSITEAGLPFWKIEKKEKKGIKI
jgi:hypothetical protein